MSAAKIGLPILLAGGAVAAFLLSRKSEASEGDDAWDGYEGDDRDTGTGPGDRPIGPIWTQPITFNPPGTLGINPGAWRGLRNLDRLTRQGRVNEILDGLEQRAAGLGLALDDIRAVVDQLGIRAYPANLERVIVSMEALDELIPLISGLGAPITPPAHARNVPALSNEADVREVQQALNRIEALVVEASMVQWGLWLEIEVPGYEGLELSRQFGSSVFTTYVNQLQQVRAVGTWTPVNHMFLAVFDGRVCGQRGALMESQGIEWQATGGQLRVPRDPPYTPVTARGWASEFYPNNPNPGRTIGGWTWPLVVDGIQGPCTDYAQSVIFAAATYVGLADVASGITGMDPRTGNQNPSYFDPMGVVRDIERDPVIAHHLALGYRAMKQAGLIEWELRTPGP